MSYERTIEDMISLKLPVNAVASKDDSKIAYVVREPNLMDNRYESKCFIHNVKTGKNHQLTQSGSVGQIAWLNENDLLLSKTQFGKNGSQQISLDRGFLIFDPAPKSESLHEY